VENVPAVFAGNGFSPLLSRKSDKGRAVRHVEKNFTADNVNNGTGRIKHISKTIISLISSRQSMKKNRKKNQRGRLLVNRRDRTIHPPPFYPEQPLRNQFCQWISSLLGWAKQMLSLSSIWFFRSPAMVVPELPESHDISPDFSPTNRQVISRGMIGITCCNIYGYRQSNPALILRGIMGITY
jgi:hypothetical protein